MKDINVLYSRIKNLLATSVILLGSISACTPLVSPVPLSPFESQARGVKGDSDSKASSRTDVRRAPGARLNLDNALAQAGTNANTKKTVPPASVFEVRWSLPTSSTNVTDFRIDYGTTETKLANSVKLARKELESEYSPDKKSLIFHHPVSVAGEVSTVAVRVTAISDDLKETASAIFSSQRVQNSGSENGFEGS